MSQWRRRKRGAKPRSVQIDRVHPTSDTHGRPSNSQRNNLSCRTEASVHTMSKGPVAGMCQSAPASLPSSCIQFHLVTQPLFTRNDFHSYLRQVDFLPHWRCRTGELQLANVGRIRSISETQNKTGKFTGRQPFALDTHLDTFCAQGPACFKISDCSCLLMRLTFS